MDQQETLDLIRSITDKVLDSVYNRQHTYTLTRCWRPRRCAITGEQLLFKMAYKKVTRTHKYFVKEETEWFSKNQGLLLILKSSVRS